MSIICQHRGDKAGIKGMSLSGLRVMVVTNGNFFARLIISRMLAECRVAGVGVLEVQGDYGGRTGLRSVLWLARRTALPYLVFKIATIAATWLGQRIAGSTGPRHAYSGVQQVSSVTRVSSDGAMEFVGAFEPDIIVSVSCPQKVPSALLSLARLGAINVHSSLLPRYAGLAPYFWVLADNERATGTTVHYMTSRFDEGRILCQRLVAVEPGCSAFSLFRRLAREGGEALAEAIRLVAQGCPGTEQSLEKKTYYSHPDFEAYVRLRKNGFSLVKFGELLALARGSANEA